MGTHRRESDGRRFSLECKQNTPRRDYIPGADLPTAAVVLDQAPAWFADYAQSLRTRHSASRRPTSTGRRWK